MPNRTDVYKLIDSEREYQEEMGRKVGWGEGQGASNHSVGDYLTMMQAYMEEARHAYIRTTGDMTSLDIIRKITALGVACMEKHGAPERKR